MTDAARSRSDAGSKVTPETKAAEARVGSTIRGKWHVDALLGVGGMAAVYAATHRVNGRRAALKVLHSEFARDGAIRDRFLREGYVGNKIPHRGRVEVLDDDSTDDGSPMLIMELLEGETLDQIWKRLGRKVPLVATLNIAEQLLDFLAACHGQGIVHRDLKPANVFITNERAVKVLDFGVAQLREGESTEHTRAGTTLGTPAYMSPEQARGLGDKLDGRADIFSVGAMLYALLSGKRLHSGRTNDEALILAATQPAPSIARIAPELPAAVIALVDKSLAWDRRQRFADAGEMRAAVLAVLEKMGARKTSPEPQEFDVEDVSGEAEEAEPSVAIASELADDNDPGVEKLRSVFRQVERLLPSVRQYGWAHPETERKLRTAFEEIVGALTESPASVHWVVRPYSFAHRGREVWEPTAPLDVVPYGLFEAGVRVMRFSPGFTESELRGLLGVMLLDPATDLAPEDDLSTLLWELDAAHVNIECADGFAEGGAAAREAFYEEEEELEKLADRAAKAARAEARAMAVQTDREQLGADPLAASLGLDATTKLALSTQLAIPSDRWTERYIDALVDALLETRRAGDVELVVTPLSLSVGDLIVAGRAQVAVSLHRAILDVLAARLRADESQRLGGALTVAMFGGQNFALMLKAFTAAAAPSAEREPLAQALTTSLGLLGAEALPAVIAGLEAAADPALRPALLAFIARAGVGQERLLLARLPDLPSDVSRALMAIIAKMPGETARAVMNELAQGPDLLLRLHAVMLRASSPDQLRAELGRLAEHERSDVRLAALSAIAERELRDLAPQLARRVEDPTFHSLPVDERAATFSVLHALDHRRAEQAAIELLSQRQMIKSEACDHTRVIAAELLGAHARSSEALEAVSAAGKGWWGTSEELKNAALSAARAIDERRRAPSAPHKPGAGR